MKVGNDNRDLCAGDDKDNQHNKEESKDEVDLRQPNCGHDKEEFDKDGAKRKNSTDKNARDWVKIPWLRRNLTRNVVYLDGEFYFVSFESIKRTYSN